MLHDIRTSPVSRCRRTLPQPSQGVLRACMAGARSVGPTQRRQPVTLGQRTRGSPVMTVTHAQHSTAQHARTTCVSRDDQHFCSCLVPAPQRSKRPVLGHMRHYACFRAGRARRMAWQGKAGQGRGPCCLQGPGQPMTGTGPRWPRKPAPPLTTAAATFTHDAGCMLLTF
jgi:hypothetical protein